MYEKMGRYPEVKEALPTTYATKSRTAKILTPIVVTGTVGALSIVSTMGIAVAIAAFASNRLKIGSVSAAQGLLLSACLFSILYIGLHIRAAIDNEPVGVIRPPVIKIHGMSFVAARVAALFWIIAMITSCAVIAKPAVCGVASTSCKLQAVSVFVSIFALTITGVILTALESCNQPFEVPGFLHRRIFSTKGSQDADDIEAYQRSVSQTSLYHDAQGDITEKAGEIKELAKPDTPKLSPISRERRMTSLLPNPPKRTRSRGWGDEWTHPTESNKLAMKHSDSAISMSMSDSSSGYARSSSGYARSSTVSGYGSNSDREFNPKRAHSQRPYIQRSVTPSSSISNLSRRSPLSTMRSADRPDIAVRPTLRYTPPLIPPPHVWRHSRTASMSQLLPVADIHTIQRRASNLERPVRLRGPIKELPPIPGSPPNRIRRNTLGSSRRMTRNDLNSYHERELEDHLRKIETSIARSRSQHQLARSAFSQAQLERAQTLVPARARNLNNQVPPLQTKRESFISPQPLTKPQPVFIVQRAHTSAGELHQESSRFEDALEISFEKVKPLRRLSLGNLPIGLDWGTSWGI